ncbi:MAG: hypothetical protein B7X31_03340 [Thiomonas sp. 13-66-29]|nr:MAG: hypothetical protein B7X31_03340 [Thiomonas sp. 13-66-29]
MPKRKMPATPARPLPPTGPGWQQALLWAALALLLHALALHALGQAFTPIEPGRLPRPIYARLLQPTTTHPQPNAPAMQAAPQHPPAAGRPAASDRPALRLSDTPQARPASAPAQAPSPPRPSASAPRPARTGPPSSQATAGMGPAMPLSAPKPQAHSLSGDDASGQVAVSRMPEGHAVGIPSAAASGGPKTQAASGAQAGAGAASGAPAGYAPGSSPRAQAPTASAPPASASTAAQQPDAYGWPPSTELRYVLTGNYRGPLHGDGALEWVRDGDRYRVELSGAALVSFAYTSTGRIDHNWLAPDRYVERVFTRRKEVDFNRDQGTLSFSAISTVMPLPAHLQDSASIFMQLAHLLSTQPTHFSAGQTLAFQVARPSGTTIWDFTITDQETVKTGIGALSCWHLDHASRDGELGAEVWLAPALQNLPVQIRLQQDAETFLLFTLSQARQ